MSHESAFYVHQLSFISETAESGKGKNTDICQYQIRKSDTDSSGCNLTVSVCGEMYCVLQCIFVQCLLTSDHSFIMEWLLAPRCKYLHLNSLFDLQWVWQIRKTSKMCSNINILYSMKYLYTMLLYYRQHLLLHRMQIYICYLLYWCAECLFYYSCDYLFF